MRIPIQAEGTRQILTTSSFARVGIVAAQNRRTGRGRPAVGTLVEQSPQFTAILGENKTLCCGSVDQANGTGKNCARLHPFSACAGDILACPEGELLTDEGNGGCA